jgi:hypothetical protein
MTEYNLTTFLIMTKWYIAVPKFIFHALIKAHIWQDKRKADL